MIRKPLKNKTETCATLLMNVSSKERTSGGAPELHRDCAQPAIPSGPEVSKEVGRPLLGAGDGLATEPPVAKANKKGVWGCHKQRGLSPV